ncbi:xanthine dehydrogenase family protein molybdopterin-binding subunit [Rhodococcus sp. IEGM 1408]|uniref:xanthine dehydrogenase family protein molybdopterin-binding subunit n=1 Tax=Rhodococcus sp. IEGM 1408 TaxID=3082220 RepID=UPI00295333B8|nr:xanthine dehydrogenase family protein molybdopterin-binding subunit [Rhodococcus sp. IEGM 1408]MDV8000680.1 xanthine dehydrogenase family protein molybdopterin-binding subunit [Rhodococcus sp. IEGM 1408]
MSAIGISTPRLDGPAKVTGTAPYAYEHTDPDASPVYLFPVTATITRGSVTSMDTADAESHPGVLAVLTPWNAPRLADTSEREYALLQDTDVLYRGQPIGLVVAETAEAARYAQTLVRVEYDQQPHDVVFRTDHPDAYEPEEVNGGYPPTSTTGEMGPAVARAEANGHVVDQSFSTPEEHNNPMEPHTVAALWDPHQPLLTLYDSTQSPHGVASTLAPVLGVEAEQIRVIALHVGGGFGSKGAPHAHDVLAALAAMALPGRLVKYAVTRQQMFVFVGYRPRTVSRIRLAADTDGRLTAIGHEAWSQSSRVKEFVEQSAVPSRSMYAAPNRRTSHRAVPLDVPAPYWMRAPGEAPGAFAAEVAMDELAHACGLDPIELRVRNDPDTDPETGKPWTSRRLVDCLREGADRFGWSERPTTPASRREGRWLVGYGVAGAAYPHLVQPGTRVTIRAEGDGRYRVLVGAVDIGTGTWTALTAIAADALDRPAEAITLEIGDTALPWASVAGGSSGTSSWGSAIVAAAGRFRTRYGDDPPAGAETTAAAGDNPELERYRAISFGAQFVEARVDADTGEIRVPRMLGVFSIGRVVNPRMVRSQFIGGMTFGLSMALHEQSVRDARFGHVVTQNLADYHIPTHADAADIDAVWLDEVDEHATPMGTRGAGEIGNVGSAAAVVNAIHNATGARIRDLPVHADTLLGYLPADQ